MSGVGLQSLQEESGEFQLRFFDTEKKSKNCNRCIVIVSLQLGHLNRYQKCAGWAFIVDHQVRVDRRHAATMRERKRLRKVILILQGLARISLIFAPFLHHLFLSDPGKPGVRSLGPDVCPSQTN